MASDVAYTEDFLRHAQECSIYIARSWKIMMWYKVVDLKPGPYFRPGVMDNIKLVQGQFFDF